MARVLIVYGTTDGHTAKVARRMGQMLTAGGIASTTVIHPPDRSHGRMTTTP